MDDFYTKLTKLELFLLKQKVDLSKQQLNLKFLRAELLGEDLPSIPPILCTDLQDANPKDDLRSLLKETDLKLTIAKLELKRMALVKELNEVEND